MGDEVLKAGLNALAKKNSKIKPNLQVGTV